MIGPREGQNSAGIKVLKPVTKIVLAEKRPSALGFRRKRQTEQFKIDVSSRNSGSGGLRSILFSALC
jgi:hypothetical protein